ncbi:Uncharacterised protein [Chlamydia trachomatis]|nr:Uncharacterised protein [Chlamydia trachomatis]
MGSPSCDIRAGSGRVSAGLCPCRVGLVEEVAQGGVVEFDRGVVVVEVALLTGVEDRIVGCGREQGGFAFGLAQGGTDGPVDEPHGRSELTENPVVEVVQQSEVEADVLFVVGLALLSVLAHVGDVAPELRVARSPYSRDEIDANAEVKRLADVDDFGKGLVAVAGVEGGAEDEGLDERVEGHRADEAS